jgi:hypothetical protein
MTSCGLNGGPLSGTGEYSARIACNLSGKDGACFSQFENKKKNTAHPYFTQSGADRENDDDQYIANMRDGSWAGFKYFDFHGEHEISVRIRGNAKGVFTVTARRDGKPLAVVDIQPGEQWTDVSSPFVTEDGVSALYFTFNGTGYLDFKSLLIS